MVLPVVDPILARDYPRPIREAYRSALRRPSLAERHQQLLRLGEIALAHLASLAFADYRRSRAGDADEKVEEYLRSTKRFTMGQYVAVFRQTQRALGRQEIFGLKRYEVNVRLENAQRWISAVRAVEHAQKIGATDVRRVVDEGLRQPAKGVRWLAFWDELVTYRNRIAHADAHGWPIDAVGYYDAMAPVLEAALVDALRTEYISDVLLEYPVSDLVEVRRSSSGWVQRFDGEYHGVPLMEEVVRDAPPEPWESEIGCPYVLERAGSGWSPHSRYFDLSLAVPAPLVQGTARQPSDASIPPTAGSPRKVGDPLKGASTSSATQPASVRAAGSLPDAGRQTLGSPDDGRGDGAKARAGAPAGERASSADPAEAIELEAPASRPQQGDSPRVPDAGATNAARNSQTTYKGWTEAQLRQVLPAASEQVQDILRYIASHPECTSREIASALGLRSERSVGPYLNGLTRVARRFGVHDRGTVRWPLEWPGRRGGYEMYDMPPWIRAVVLDVLRS